jgi:streptogramin lyase
VIVWLLIACGSEPLVRELPSDDPGCIDRDGDGYGSSCDRGDDCDDGDDRRGGPELCDEVDNDCNGMVDDDEEGLCRGCADGSCTTHEVPGTRGFEPTPESSDGVIVDSAEALTLGRADGGETFHVWTANTGEGTVSKIDSRSGTEIARYASARPDATNNARPWNEPCNDGAAPAPMGNCPSRTAVDQRFDAYVANRAFGNQGTITKIANREEHCVDRNGNGVIDTSRDANGSGGIDLFDPAEFFGYDDECLLWTVPVGAPNAVPRALAVGLAGLDATIGSIWVGLWQSQAVCELDPETGATRVCIETPGMRPYGAATDAFGSVWIASRHGPEDAFLGRVDTAAMTFEAIDRPAHGCAGMQPYGITVDGSGVVYLTSPDCEPGVWLYDPGIDEWAPITLPYGGSPRGLAADETSLWIAVSHETSGFAGGVAGRVVQLDLEDGTWIATHQIPTGRAPVGVGVSYDGSIWAICMGDGISNGIAARLDPVSGAWMERTVGVRPYTYSDFVGFGLNVFAQPNGWYRTTLEGCAEGETEWRGVRYTAEVPSSTAVEIWTRSADTRAELEAQPWTGPFLDNPASFASRPGPISRARYLELEVRLRTVDRTAAPRVFDVFVVSACH